MLSLGAYPEISLAQARQRRDEARRLAAAGQDPSAARKAEKATQAAAAEVTRAVEAGLPVSGTFAHAACEWLATVHEARALSRALR